MSDLIDRQAAIDSINAYLGLSAVSRTIQNMTSIQEILENLPSAEPERKKGKWLLIDAGYYDYVKCSQCGETLVWGKNFCPNCGAEMREGEE